MVGVPGRSKGCLTCRKRKKGCDQQRPICGQCHRGNLICQGYPSDMTFVRYSPTRVGASHFKVDPHGETEGGKLIARTPSPVLSGDMAFLSSSLESFTFDEYWQSFNPKGRYKDSRWTAKGDELTTWTPAGWMFELRKHSESDILVRTGWQANAYTMFGKKTGDKRFSVASLQAYSRVLQEVQICLQDPAKRKSNSVLAACRFLAMYEAYQGAGANWESHTLGVLRVLEVRGPAAHQTGIGHSMFLDARYQGIVASIRRRQPTFLGTKAWCTVPFAVQGKDYRQEVCDTLANIAKLQYEYDNLKSGLVPEYESLQRRMAYFELCQSTRKQLNGWYDRLVLRYDADRIGLLSDGIPENFPIGNIMLAHSMALYWSAVMLVNFQELCGLRDIPVPGYPSPDYDSDRESESNLEIMPYILRIARSIRYFFQTDAGSLCPQGFSFPLGAALNIAAYVNAKAVPEYRRLLRAFASGRMGQQTRQFLTSLLVLSDPDWGIMASDSIDDDSYHANYEEVRHNSKKYHDEGMFMRRPLETTA